MNYDITQSLLDAISPYCDLDNISVSTENKVWKGSPYQTDFVTLIEKNNVHFKVFDNEIIISYFTDHKHFEDYTFELEDGEPDFAARAKEFLVLLFTLPIRHTEVYKGTKLLSEKHYFAHPGGEEHCISGIILHKLIFGFNPFARKHINITTWQYDVKKGCFTTSQLWKPNPNAIEVIEIADKYIEIYEKSGVFTFTIWHTEYDDYYGMHYWTPIDKGTASFFDTKEKAIEAAKEMLK